MKQSLCERKKSPENTRMASEKEISISLEGRPRFFENTSRANAKGEKGANGTFRICVVDKSRECQKFSSETILARIKSQTKKISL